MKKIFLGEETSSEEDDVPPYDVLGMVEEVNRKYNTSQKVLTVKMRDLKEGEGLQAHINNVFGALVEHVKQGAKYGPS